MPAQLKKGKKPDQLIVHQLNIQSTNRNTQDIDNWRTALQAFENPSFPNRTPMFDLLANIDLDGQVISTFEKRIDAICNKEFLFVRDGKEDEELVKLLNCPAMIELCKSLFNAIKYGHALIQVNNIWYDEDEELYKIDFDEIPRKHVHPERGWECISRDQMLSKDILYKERPLYDYMIEAGDPKSYGMLFPLAQYVIYKRGGFGDWSQFSEMFGMPFREGEYDAFDEQSRALLNDAMENWGGAGWLTHPKGTTIKLHDVGGSSGSSGGPYDALISKCDAQISKIVLGNTLTTEQGNKGTQALGTVHADAESEKNKRDSRFILAILNGKFKSILKRFGFNVAGGEIWFKSPDKDWSELQTKWTVISGMKDKGLPIDDDFIYEEFDIPKPANYDQQVETHGRASENNKTPEKSTNEPDPNNPDKKKPVKQSDEERNFFIRLVDFFAHAPAKKTGATLAGKSKTYTPNKNAALRLPPSPFGGGTGWGLSDSATQPFDLSNLFDTVLRNIYEEMVDVTDDIEPNLWQFTTNKLNEAVDHVFVSDNGTFADELKYNNAVFAAFKTHTQQNELHALLLDENGDLKPFNQYLNDTQTVIGKYNVNWLQTEYDTAVLRGRIAQQWKQFEADSDLFPNLKWLPSTSLERRTFHQRFADLPIILPITHPFWKKHLPGELWNCKCGLTNTDEPAIQDKDIPDVDFKPDPGLDNNPAMDSKLFSESHPFISGAGEEVHKVVAKFMRENVSRKGEIIIKVRFNPEPEVVDKERRKEIVKWAKENLLGKEIKVKAFDRPVIINSSGIKEFINQPHKFYNEKNELYTKIASVIKKAKYLGYTDYHKPGNAMIVKSHIFETKIMGETSYMIVRENILGELHLYSISDNEKVIIGIKK